MNLPFDFSLRLGVVRATASDGDAVGSLDGCNGLIDELASVVLCGRGDSKGQRAWGALSGVR